MTSGKQLFQICKLSLVYGGVSAQGLPTWSNFSRRTYKVVSIFFQLNYILCLPLFITNFITNFRINVEATVSVMRSISFVGVIIAKMMIIQSSKVQNLISVLSNEEKDIMASENLEMKKIYKGQVIYCYRIATCTVSWSYMVGMIYIIDALIRSYLFYRTQDGQSPKPHPIDFWYPFDKDIYYKIAMAYEICHILQTSHYNLPVQTVIHTVMVFFKAELKLLQYYIRNIDVNISGQEQYKCLKSYIIHHQKLLRWIEQFNEYFRHIILLEYSVSSLMFAMTLFDLLQGRKIIFNAIFFVLGTLQFSALAWNANEILHESSLGLSRAIYECSWYNLDELSRKLIRYMIMRCSKPMVIKIGPFGFMTLDAAMSRMKLAYSVVSVLSTTT